MGESYNRWGEGSQSWERWMNNRWAVADEDMPRRDKKGASDSIGTEWPDDLNTAKDVDYLTPLEKAIIFEYNKVRFDPARYAKEYLEPMRSMFSGKSYTIPSLGRYTSEGVAVLEETIKELKEKRAPLAPYKKLYPLKGLFLACEFHALDQGKTGEMGHEGSNGSTTMTRVTAYTKPGFAPWTAYENLVYGQVCKYVRWSIAELLIDDEISGRVHRHDFFKEECDQIGVCIRAHPQKLSSVHLIASGLYDK
jgi:uncharacterized protein YkwD